MKVHVYRWTEGEGSKTPIYCAAIHKNKIDLLGNVLPQVKVTTITNVDKTWVDAEISRIINNTLGEVRQRPRVPIDKYTYDITDLGGIVIDSE